MGGQSVAFEFRTQDARLGRFLSTDPLAAMRANQSPYVFAANNPVWNVDYLGLIDSSGTEKISGPKNESLRIEDPDSDGDDVINSAEFDGEVYTVNAEKKHHQGDVKTTSTTHESREEGTVTASRDWYFDEGKTYLPSGWHNKETYDWGQLDHAGGQIMHPTTYWGQVWGHYSGSRSVTIGHVWYPVDYNGYIVFHKGEIAPIGGAGSLEFLSGPGKITKGTQLLNKGFRFSSFIAKFKAKLKLYPRVLDLRTGRGIHLPHVNGIVPKALRVKWDKIERGKFIKEWHDRGFPRPKGGWKQYDIHHIKPREYGGTNDFWNLTPVLRETHQKEFNAFWRKFGDL